MAQKDKDMLAFEAWANRTGYPSERISKYMNPSRPEEYQHTSTQERWKAWQAARDYYRNEYSEVKK